MPFAQIQKHPVIPHPTRRAFENVEIFADITGVNVELINRLKNILIAVCSCYHLNLEKFTPYCQQTSDYIIQEYNWYIIPPSVHKLLEHGSKIAEYLELPIGQYSEEALEAQNRAVQRIIKR